MLEKSSFDANTNLENTAIWCATKLFAAIRLSKMGPQRAILMCATDGNLNRLQIFLFYTYFFVHIHLKDAVAMPKMFLSCTMSCISVEVVCASFWFYFGSETDYVAERVLTSDQKCKKHNLTPKHERRKTQLGAHWVFEAFYLIFHVTKNANLFFKTAYFYVCNRLKPLKTLFLRL